MIYLLSRNNKSNNFNGVKEEKNSGESIICQNVNLSNNIPNYLLIGWFHYILSSWKKNQHNKANLCHKNWTLWYQELMER